MALNIHLLINEHPIGYIGIQRTKGNIGTQCEYRYTIRLNDDDAIDGDGIKHHYDDGAVELLRKVLEANHDAI